MYKQRNVVKTIRKRNKIEETRKCFNVENVNYHLNYKKRQVSNITFTIKLNFLFDQYPLQSNILILF